MPTVDPITLGPGMRRTATLTFPVHFIYARHAGMPQRVEELYGWMDVLYTLLDGTVHLGLESYVRGAEVIAIRPGVLRYGEGDEYDSLTLTVVVYVVEGATLVA